MEYTNDIILNVKYKDSKENHDIKEKHKLIKNIIKKIYNDEFLTISVIISIIVLSIDFFIIKYFIQILNLL